MLEAEIEVYVAVEQLMQKDGFITLLEPVKNKWRQDSFTVEYFVFLSYKTQTNSLISFFVLQSLIEESMG